MCPLHNNEVNSLLLLLFVYCFSFLVAISSMKTICLVHSVIALHFKQMSIIYQSCNKYLLKEYFSHCLWRRYLHYLPYIDKETEVLKKLVHGSIVLIVS